MNTNPITAPLNRDCQIISRVVPLRFSAKCIFLHLFCYKSRSIPPTACMELPVIAKRKQQWYIYQQFGQNHHNQRVVVQYWIPFKLVIFQEHHNGTVFFCLVFHRLFFLSLKMNLLLKVLIFRFARIARTRCGSIATCQAAHGMRRDLNMLTTMVGFPINYNSFLHFWLAGMLLVFNDYKSVWLSYLL